MEFCVNASWMANLCILRLLLLSPLHLVLDPCFLFDFIWFNAPWKTAISKQTPYLRCANLENFDKSQGRRTISLFPARCIRAAAGQRSWGDLVQNGPEWSRIPDFPPGRWNPFSFFRFFGNSDGDLHFYLWDILGSHSEHVGAWETKLIRWFLPFSTQSQDSRPSLCCALQTRSHRQRNPCGYSHGWKSSPSTINKYYKLVIFQQTMFDYRRLS